MFFDIFERPQMAPDDNEIRLRQLADSLDCLTESDFLLLTDATPLTVEAWRKRGTGPAYIRIGTRYLYPRKPLAKHLESITRSRAPLAKSAL